MIFQKILDESKNKDEKYFDTCFSLGEAKRYLKKNLEAKKLWQNCIDQIERIQKIELKWIKNKIQVELAFLMSVNGNNKQALKTLYEALEERKGIFGEEHISLVLVYTTLSMIYQEMRNGDQSTYYSKLVIKLLEKHFGPKHKRMAIPWFNLGVQYDDRGMFTEAEKSILKGISILEPIEPNNRRLGFIYGGLAITYNNHKHFQKGLDTAKKAKSINLLYYKKDSLRIARDNVILANAYYGLNDINQARKLLDGSYDTYRKPIPDHHSAAIDIDELYRNVYGEECAIHRHHFNFLISKSCL